MDAFAELCYVQNKGGQDRFEDRDHGLNASIFEDRSDDGFKDVSEYLGGFEWLELKLVHLKVFLEPICNVHVHVVVFTGTVLYLFKFPVHQLIFHLVLELTCWFLS